MKSLVRRRLMVFLVDSSVKKIKTTWWIPSRGMRVRVDLANLRWREGGEERERENQQKRVMCCINVDKLQRQNLELT